MDVQDMRIFARVAALQNLSAAGNELGLTAGTISKRLQALEDDLGARLFERNTRSVRITEEGQMLLTHVEKILIDIEGARAVVGANAVNPRGTLRIATPLVVGGVCIIPAICAFMQANREVDVLVDITERVINLQEDGYDVAISAGAPFNMALKRKVLLGDLQVLVASAAYVSANGCPATPSDLADHSCLVQGESALWEFRREQEPFAVRVSGRLKSDCAEALLYGARAGIGIVKTSRARVAQDLGQGNLIEILAAYEIATDDLVCALYQGSKHVLPKLRVFLDFLGVWFRNVEPKPERIDSPATLDNSGITARGSRASLS